MDGKVRRARDRRFGVVATALAMLGGCTTTPLEAPRPRPEMEVGLSFEARPRYELDLLVLIDNSHSMKEEQENLRRNLPELIRALRGLPNGLPNLHVAIISSDVGAGPNPKRTQGGCYHEGVVGGDRGGFRVKRGCGLDDAKATFLISEGNDTQRNFEGALEDVFGCLAELGTGGCGFEQQLLATELAFDTNLNPKNAGFLRKDAYLAVVYVTDEDDCSADPNTTRLFDDDAMYPKQTANVRCAIRGHRCRGQALPNGEAFTAPLASCEAAPNGEGPHDLLPVQRFVDFLKSRKRDPQKVIVSGIVGWPTEQGGGARYEIAPKPLAGSLNDDQLLELAPVCSSATNGEAMPGLRMKSFIDAFGANGRLDSICAGDFRPAMQNIGRLLIDALERTCIDADLLDTDAAKPGLQADCSVVDRVGLEARDDALAACNPDMTNTPCWRLLAPADQPTGRACADGRHRLVIERGGREAPFDAHVVVRCAACVPGRGRAGCACDPQAAPTCAEGLLCNDQGRCSAAVE